jgi:hypothetical protein
VPLEYTAIMCRLKNLPPERRYLKIALDTELLEDICSENGRSFQHMVGK